MSTGSVVVAGIFKFQEAGPGAEQAPTIMVLTHVAEEWLAEARDRFEFLHVRGCGTRQIGIEFRYRRPVTEKHDRWVWKMTDQLKRKFGNDLVAWDIDDNVSVVK